MLLIRNKTEGGRMIELAVHQEPIEIWIENVSQDLLRIHVSMRETKTNLRRTLTDLGVDHEVAIEAMDIWSRDDLSRSFEVEGELLIVKLKS
jgi:hypothetical protein